MKPVKPIQTLISSLAVVAVLSTLWAICAGPTFAQEASDYVEILEGDMPLVFAVGHGGWKDVGTIKNTGPDWNNDPLVQEYFYQVLAVRIYERTGHLPYIVYQQGRRNYSNVNQYVNNSQAYHPSNLEAKAAYFEFHDQLDAMIVRIEAYYGSNLAILVNPHSTDLSRSIGGTPWDRIADIGFIASVTNLGYDANTMKALYDRLGQVALRGEDSVPYQFFHARDWPDPDAVWPEAATINSKDLTRIGEDVWHVLPAFVTGWDTDNWVTAPYNGRTVVLYHGSNTLSRVSYWQNGLDAFQIEVNHTRQSGLALRPEDPGFDPDPSAPYYQLDVPFTTDVMDALIDALLYSLEVNYGWTPGGAQNVIVDNGDPGFSVTGAWQESTGNGSWNTLSVWSDTAGDTATWTPTISQTGDYEVLVRWTDTGYRAYDAGYTVNYAGGLSSTFVFDQSGGQDAKWVSLGYFPFDAGTSGSVVLACSGTGNSTSADAALFRLDDRPPLVPQLYSPANGAFISDTTPTLTWWSPSLDTAGYWLNFGGSVTDLGNTSGYTTPVLAEETFTWTVAAYDHVSHTSAYAAVYSFTVDITPPEPCALLTPTNGALVSDTTPTLVWQASPSPDVLGYRLNFSGTIVDVGNTTQYTLAVLSADDAYTWTIAPYDRALNTGDYADVWAFTLDSTPPIIPALHSPPNGALFSNTLVSLAWRASPSPDTAGYVLNWNDAITDVGNTIVYSINVQVDGVYTWSVAAYDGLHNTSPYTDNWTLTIDSTPPLLPGLLSPPNGALLNDTTPTLIWASSPSTDTAGYILSWNSVLTDVGASTQYTTPVLNDGVYTWTLAAYDQLANTSAFTDVYTLSIDATPPQVQQTYPATAATDAPIDAQVQITFNEPVLTDTFAFSITPDPGGWLAWWNGEATMVTLSHAPFAYLTAYTPSVNALQDLASNAITPITWTFTTQAPGCIDVIGVSLSKSSPDVVHPGNTVVFNADMAPDDLDTPYNYRVTVDDLAGLVQSSAANPLVFIDSFAATGTHSVDIAVWNCELSEAQAITAHLDVEVYTPGVCRDLTSIAISGQTSGLPGEYVFDADYQPAEASAPINYLWDNGDGSASSTRLLDVGVHTLTVTATNCLQRSSQTLVVDTHVITISNVLTCTEVTQVDLTQLTPDPIYAGHAFDLQATISPGIASPLYTYTINYGDGAAPITASSSDNPLLFNYTYTSVGSFAVDLAVWNCDMTPAQAITDAVWINVEQFIADSWVYLPVVVKNH